MTTPLSGEREKLAALIAGWREAARIRVTMCDVSNSDQYARQSTYAEALNSVADELEGALSHGVRVQGEPKPQQECIRCSSLGPMVTLCEDCATLYGNAATIAADMIESHHVGVQGEPPHGCPGCGEDIVQCEKCRRTFLLREARAAAEGPLHCTETLEGRACILPGKHAGPHAGKEGERLIQWFTGGGILPARASQGAGGREPAPQPWRQAPMHGERNVFWLIEAPRAPKGHGINGSEGGWWYGRDFNVGHNQFSWDIEKAIQFRTKEDAELVMRCAGIGIPGDGISVTDHRWMSGPPPVAPPDWRERAARVAEGDLPIAIVVEETKKDYGVRLCHAIAERIRALPELPGLPHRTRRRDEPA